MRSRRAGIAVVLAFLASSLGCMPLAAARQAAQLELFNLAQDPSETTNLADEHPQRVAELQRRIEALAREAVPPLLLGEAFGVAKAALFGTVATPDEEQFLEQP